MPILPLDHPEPFAAMLGIMLYPGADEAERRSAGSYTLKYLARPIEEFRKQGGELAAEQLVRLVTDGGADLPDLESRGRSGRMMGEVFKTYFFLAQTHPDRASWSNAIRIVTHLAGHAGERAGRSVLKDRLAAFRPVAHLWAAGAIREWRFQDDPAVGYELADDFQSFLTEAEILRRWGQSWKQDRAKATPPLAEDVWRVPDGWRPPRRSPTWPPTGQIPDLALPPALVDLVRPGGRPKKEP